MSARFPVKAKLDLPSYVGQRSATFRFDIVDAITGYRRRVYPAQQPEPTLTHTTSNTIKRTLGSVYLDRDDTAAFNSVSSRLEVSMLVGGETYGLGRYIPSDWIGFITTAGRTSSATFYDESFIIDQQITTSFGAVSVGGDKVDAMIQRFLDRYPVDYTIEPTDFTSLGSWSIGTRGGFVLEQLALDGDYFAPWMDYTSTLRFIRSFDPATKIPDFDFDAGRRVIREDIQETDNLIEAPNRFIVIGNGSAALDNEIPIIGSADVPNNSPNSILNRGFVIPETVTRQVQTSAQATAVAENLVRRQTLFKQVELGTAPDPRHDSYDVIKWQGENWLELGWSLPLREGAVMKHSLRRAYS